MNVYLDDDITTAINDVVSEIKDVAIKTQTFVLDKNKKNICFKTNIQACINHQFNHPLKKEIHKVLVDYCFLSERKSPGGFIKTLYEISSLLNEEKKNEINQTVYYPKISDLKKLVINLINDKIISDICVEASILAGFGGKITIEKSVNQTTSIELIEGYNFKHRNVGLPSIKLTKPNVLTIDGYVESVSEINLLFQDVVDSKHPLVLITRGMHEDVLNTIKINKDRKTMFVYPVIIDFDLQGINTIADISIVSNVTPVSENSGDLISSTSLSKSNIVDEVMIIGNNITIKNSKNKHNVNVHIKNLIEKRSESKIEVESLITERIKSLSSSNVIIRLPNDSSYITKSQLIDYFLRSIKSMLDYGIIFNKDDIELYATLKSSKEYSKKFLKQVKSINSAIC